MSFNVLDVCCCAGGAAKGYADEGATVTGVDVSEQPNYPFTFVRADGVQYIKDHGHEFDFIHVSPPCQAKCSLTLGTNAGMADRYVDLYDVFRDAVYESGKPGAIENPRSRPDMLLCGEMFGLGVLRHRKIELVNWAAPKPEHVKHRGRVRGYRHGVWHDGPYIAAYGNGGGKGSVKEMQDAMGIHWTDVRHELTEAIPPAYTAYIARAFLAQR